MTDYFASQQKLLKTLTDKLGDADLADDFIENIFSIGDRYSLTLGEMGELCSIFEKIIREETRQDELLENLLEKLGASEEEVLDITAFLEELINQFKEIEVIAQKLKEVKKELLK